MHHEATKSLHDIFYGMNKKKYHAVISGGAASVKRSVQSYIIFYDFLEEKWLLGQDSNLQPIG